MKWDDLDYWSSDDHQLAMEKLDELDGAGTRYTPRRSEIFRGLEWCPFEATRVVIVGQDPYPNPVHATGVAFSVPRDVKELPASLRNIFSELVADLHCSYPACGDLTPWVRQGVLLWNVFPVCQVGKPGSLRWPEWVPLTIEIIEKLDKRADPVVFVFLGRDAQEFQDYVTDSEVISTSHPSPRGATRGFFGSRLFSSINGRLVEAGHPAVDWRL